MVAQQSISQIRTVAAYTQERRMQKDYSFALAEPLQAGIKQAWIMGLSLGAFQLIIYSSFAIALVYGAFRVASGAYTGGTVLNVLIAVLLGGFAIMQGAPNLQYMVKVREMEVWIDCAGQWWITEVHGSMLSPGCVLLLYVWI